MRGEWVIRVDGEVKARMAETVNANLPTGEIEVFAREIEVLSAAKELPLPVFGEPDYPEDIRLKYRFLDLRRDTLHKNIVARTKIIAEMRKRMGGGRLHRIFDADPDRLVAGRRARLPGAVAHPFRANSTRCRRRRSSTSS